MDYEFQEVILQSQNKVRLLDFLCDVFDFDVDAEVLSASFGPLNFSVSDLTSSCSQNNSIEFTFKVQNQEEINRLKKKYDFFHYRNQQPFSNEKIETQECKDFIKITIFDLDNRRWNFECKKD